MLGLIYTNEDLTFAGDSSLSKSCTMHQRQNAQADQVGTLGSNCSLSKCFVFRSTPRDEIDPFLPLS